MRNFTTTFFGSMVLAGALPLAAEAAIQKQVYDIRCEQFFAATDKLDAGPFKRPRFGSAKQTLQQLDLADKYPIYPSEQAALLKKALASKGSDEDVQALLKVKPACDPAHYYAWTRRLIQSAQAYHFSTAERNRLASVLMTHFRSNALEPRPVLQQLLDVKLLRFASNNKILKLSSKQKILLHEKGPRIEQLSEKVLAREAEIEKLRAQIGEPIDSAVEKDRRQQLARFQWEQLLNSEELRAILQQVLEFVEEN